MERNLGVAKCEYCGAEYTRKNGSQRFCREACKKAFYRSGGTPIDTPGWQQCKCCGKLFKMASKYSRSLYCSEECRKMAAKQRAMERKYQRRIRRMIPDQPKAAPLPPQKKDGFTWDEIRAVLGEFGISSYQKAVEILEQRKREGENAVQAETEKKGGETE